MVETPDTRYSPRASFVCILRKRGDDIEVCVTPTVNKSGVVLSIYKLVGGTSEERVDELGVPVDNLFETHRDTIYREVLEETGGGILLGKIEEALTELASDQRDPDSRPHYRRFYLALEWEGSIETPLPSEDAPARWMSISAFRRNALQSHIEGFLACLDLKCQKNPKFLELLRRQEGFEKYEPMSVPRGGR